MIDGPLTLAHTVDVRRINSRTVGRCNIPSVGVFVWRLKPYSVSWTNAQVNDWKSPAGWTQACCVEEDAEPHCYTCSVLGNDTPLYNRPQRETDPTHIAGELNLPTPIRRQAFGDKANCKHASSDYYGPGKPGIWAPDWPKRCRWIRANIIPADLTGWHYHAPRDLMAVDPETGRMVFPARQYPGTGSQSIPIRLQRRHRRRRIRPALHAQPAGHRG